MLSRCQKKKKKKCPLRRRKKFCIDLECLGLNIFGTREAGVTQPEGNVRGLAGYLLCGKRYNPHSFIFQKSDPAKRVWNRVRCALNNPTTWFWIKFDV